MWSRPCFWIGMLLVLGVSPTGIRDSYADSSCVPLNRLLGLADTQFKRLRGYYDPRFRKWVSTYRMPGASICTIEDAENIAYFSCKWMHDPQAGTVPDAYADLLQLVARCLNIQDTSEHDPGPEQHVTRLGVAATRKTVVVGRSESSSGGHFVTLDVVPIGLNDFPGE